MATVNLTIKNIPAQVHALLKERAALNHRSLNNEIIHCLEKNTIPQPVNHEARLERIRKLRERIQPIDHMTITEMKNWGRP